MGMGKPVTNLRRLDQPRYNLPIRHHTVAEVEVAFCHACCFPSLSHLPAPPPAPHTVLNTAIWSQTEAKDSPKPAKRPRKSLTIDDIFAKLKE